MSITGTSVILTMASQGPLVFLGSGVDYHIKIARGGQAWRAYAGGVGRDAHPLNNRCRDRQREKIARK